MYVNERSGLDTLTDPYIGEFGSFADPTDQSRVTMPSDGSAGGSADATIGSGLDQIGDLLAQAGVSPATLAVSLGGCLLTGDKAGCAWNALKGLILGHPQAAVILETILTTDCATALTALGLPSTVVTAACLLGGGVWSDIQAKAAAELGVEYGTTEPSRQQQYEDDYARGRDRTDAEGGGHTLVNAEGGERAVWCPGYVRQVVRDAAGNIAVYVIEPPNTYPAGARCPQDAAGTVRREGVVPLPVPDATETRKTRTVLPGVRLPDALRQPLVRVSKTDTQSPYARAPWYRNKWIWIGVGTVTALGIGGYVWSRRRG